LRVLANCDALLHTSRKNLSANNPGIRILECVLLTSLSVRINKIYRLGDLYGAPNSTEAAFGTC